MIDTRNLVISIFGVLLSTAPLIHAQDPKLSDPTVVLQPAAIQELALEPQSFLGPWLPGESAPVLSIKAPDLSRYREFQFGMDLQEVAEQAGMQPSEARVIHQRPAVIQELEWRPISGIGTSLQADSVQEVLFSFYNAKVFRMVVVYDRYKTEGLTDEDMVEAISAKYGTAARPAATVVLFSSFQVYNNSERVIARWENSQYSFNLFRSSFQPTFGLLIFDKRLDALAQAAIAEAIRRDEQEAPQREIQRQQREDENNRESLEKARQVNKRNFRY